MRKERSQAAKTFGGYGDLPPGVPLGSAPWVVVLALLSADAVALEASLLLGLALKNLLANLLPIGTAETGISALSLGVLLFPLGYGLAGLYPGYGLSPVESSRRRVQVTFFLFLVLVAWEWLFLREGWSRGLLLLAMGWALVLVPLGSVGVREVLARLGLWGVPVLILGAGRTGALVARALLRDGTLGLSPVAFLDDDPDKQGIRVEGLPVLGPIRQVSHWAQKGLRVVILAMPGAGSRRLVEILGGLPVPRILLVPDLLGIPSLWVSSRDFGGVLALEVHKNLLLGRNRLLKRVLDYLIGVPLFLLSLPVIGIFALWVKAVSPGPAFYAQEREGHFGRTIRVWKLRTMYSDAEQRLAEYLQANPEARKEWEHYFKLRDDPRVLPGVGTFLRRTSLDELPQLWSVIRGEMSLVGPRPFPRYHMEKFSPGFRHLRQSVWPGLTGLWQVSARSDADLEVQEALDTYYIRNWSFWLDLYILARTLWVVLTRKGAY